MKRILRLCACAAVAAVVATAGCRGASEPSRRLRVAAASDLNAALADLTARFSAGSGIEVSVSYGSSGTFYAQLLNRAPFDLFFSADVEYPRLLAARGLSVRDSEFTYASGRLVAWVPSASPLDVERDGLAALTSASVTHVAIANAEHAPYGKAAVAALRSAGLYDRVQPKLVFGENVAQALQFVQSGAAEAGIVALSLAMAPSAKGQGRWYEVPLETYPRMEQGGVILQWTPDVDGARALRAFVLSAQGRAILKQYGFILPER